MSIEFDDQVSVEYMCFSMCVCIAIIIMCITPLQVEG